MRSRILILLTLVASCVCLASAVFAAQAERSWSELKAYYSQSNPLNNEGPTLPEELIVDRAVQVYGLSPDGGEQLIFELWGERARDWLAAIDHVSELVTEPGRPVCIVHSMDSRDLRAFAPQSSLAPWLFFDNLTTLLPGTQALGEILGGSGDRLEQPIDTTISCLKFCYSTNDPGACMMRCSKGSG